MEVNDDECRLDERVALRSIASMLAPTEVLLFDYENLPSVKNKSIYLLWGNRTVHRQGWMTCLSPSLLCGNENSAVKGLAPAFAGTNDSFNGWLREASLAK